MLACAGRRASGVTFGGERARQSERSPSGSPEADDVSLHFLCTSKITVTFQSGRMYVMMSRTGRKPYSERCAVAGAGSRTVLEPGGTRRKEEQEDLGAA